MGFVSLENIAQGWTPLPEDIDERIRNGIRVRAQEDWRPVLNPVWSKVLEIEVKFPDVAIEEMAPEELDNSLIKTCIEYGYQGAMHKHVRHLEGVPILHRRSAVIAANNFRSIFPLQDEHWETWQNHLPEGVDKDDTAIRMLIYTVKLTYPPIGEQDV